MSNPKDQFRIKLTPEQKAQVQAATGKDAEAVELLEQIELGALVLGGRVLVLDMLDEFLDGGVLGVDVRALIDAGEEGRLPIL